MTTDFALQQQIQSVLTIWKERCLQRISQSLSRCLEEIKKKEELQKNLSKYVFLLCAGSTAQSTPTTQHTIIRDRIPSKSVCSFECSSNSEDFSSEASCFLGARQGVILPPTSEDQCPAQERPGVCFLLLPYVLSKVLIVPQKRSEIENCRQYLEDDYEDDGFVVPDDGDDIFGEDYREALRGLNRHYGDKKYYNDDDDDVLADVLACYSQDRNMVSTIDQIENEDRVSRKIGKKVDQEEWIKIQEEERREAMRRKK